MKTKIQKSEKTMCFSREKKSAQQNEEQKHWFYYKTAAKTFQPRIRGLCYNHSAWISYEEPLQTSCLGKYRTIKNIKQVVIISHAPRRQEIDKPKIWSKPRTLGR